jgi:predicted RNA-binding Zn-ribbon protein involved in translation (DUF1610 family)
MDNFDEKTAQISTETKCKNCGALLKFAPGTTSLKCEYCGVQNEISSASDPVVIEEIDFEKFLSEQTDGAELQEVNTVKCTSCGASTTLRPNVSSDNCPFCDTPLVISSGSATKLIKPKYLLPFKIDSKKAKDSFREWISGLWFAPNDLKNYADRTDKINGMYLPYWTYDSDTLSQYIGERGVYYFETVTYETTEDGETVTREREERRIMWYPATGSVNNAFDDVLVLASNSLPDGYTRALEPWDLEHLSGFDEKFLSGFRTESYQLGIKDGFEKAKQVMDASIRQTVLTDIGGDEQRVISLQTNYSNITFKHILLPIWLSAYRYSDKVYHFMVNGRTGAVQGERPYSAVKIALAVIAAVAVIGLALYFYSKGQAHAAPRF